MEKPVALMNACEIIPEAALWEEMAARDPSSMNALEGQILFGL